MVVATRLTECQRGHQWDVQLVISCVDVAPSVYRLEVVRHRQTGGLLRVVGDVIALVEVLRTDPEPH